MPLNTSLGVIAWEGEGIQAVSQETDRTPR
jgi:hypothetical protein